LLVRDVTARQQREQRLSLFGQAIETARQGITIADAQQDDEPLIYANGAFERITGYSTAEVIGRNCRFLQGDGTDDQAVAEVGEAIDTRKPVSVELLNYRKDGTPFWNRLEIVPVSSPSGTVTHFLGLQRDVTERREREERLAVLDRVLRHNIRNRTNVIRSRAELLDDSENARTIVDAADDLTRISEQVRTFRSVVSAEQRVLESVDLAELLPQVVAAFRESYPAADLTLDCQASAPVEVRVHPTLSAALTELLELVFDSSDGDASATVRLAADDDTATLEVHDHRGDIPAADLRAIDTGTETSLDHARGLELWLIRWAVLYSEGALSVTEDEDGAPCLELRFPRS
jgi:PAS domain S-box-containing protein